MSPPNDVVARINQETVFGLQAKDCTGDITVTGNVFNINQPDKHKAILDSLYYTTITTRQNTIDPAHKATFQWLFDNTTEHEWPSFVDWLNNWGPDQPVYRVLGKPGAGKSTLMRFIHTTLSNEYSGTYSKLVSHYFWRQSGNPMDMSLRGFLCSILRQILVENDAATGKLVHDNKDVLGFVSPDSWSIEDLKRGFELAVEDGERIFFLVEGVDEMKHRQEQRHLLQFLTQLNTRHPHLKICLSSRPEAQIINLLDSFQGVKLEDLTHGDLLAYTKDKVSKFPLDEDCRDCLASCFHPICCQTTLIRHLVGEARGVFLWLCLVVNRLESGFLDLAETRDELKIHLTDLPTDISELYHRMWERMGTESKMHQRTLSFILRVLISHSGEKGMVSDGEGVGITSPTLACLLDEQLVQGTLRSLSTDDLCGLEKRLHDNHRHLHRHMLHRTAGFLQATPYSISDDALFITPRCSDYSLAQEATTYDWIHRTAYDYFTQSVDGKETLDICNLSESELAYKVMSACIARDQLADILEPIMFNNLTYACWRLNHPNGGFAVAEHHILRESYPKVYADLLSRWNSPLLSVLTVLTPQSDLEKVALHMALHPTISTILKSIECWFDGKTIAPSFMPQILYALPTQRFCSPHHYADWPLQIRAFRNKARPLAEQLYQPCWSGTLASAPFVETYDTQKLRALVTDSENMVSFLYDAFALTSIYADWVDRLKHSRWDRISTGIKRALHMPTKATTYDQLSVPINIFLKCHPHSNQSLRPVQYFPPYIFCSPGTTSKVLSGGDFVIHYSLTIQRALELLCLLFDEANKIYHFEPIADYKAIMKRIADPPPLVVEVIYETRRTDKQIILMELDVSESVKEKLTLVITDTIKPDGKILTRALEELLDKENITHTGRSLVVELDGATS